ncbi:MAG TPA: MBL fold metallo-hydrolase [Candidatus Dormibacteraeota bacterium]|nr:MBL fold metallo-hydrolase [Candidatus Dormibacteraeota bacterium]
MSSSREAASSAQMASPAAGTAVEHAVAQASESSHDYRKGESRIRRWQIGDVKVTSIMESAEPISWSPQYPEDTADHYKKYNWLVPRFVTPEGRIILAVQAFVLEAAGRRIVVDTCVGNDKSREIPHCTGLQTAFLEDMTTAGFPPETIDTVFCTHLHFDHVGWNTLLVDGRWAPTFPSARYLFARREWEYCQLLLKEKTADVRHLLDSVQPIFDAGLADLVDTNHRLSDELWLEPTHGHTPGHVSLHISSRGQDAIVTGDVFHNPIQIAEPEIASMFCVDKEMSRKTRRELLSKYGNRVARLIAIHFNDPVGWIDREADHWRYSAE